MNKNIGDGELQDKCGEVQIKLGIDDKEWKKLVGNYEGLYGFIKPLIAQEANKAQKQLLQGIIEKFPDDTTITTKYGYHSPEKRYGFRMGMKEAESVIQNKLEGLS